MGVWIYQRGGQEVIGFFTGTLRGNILEFNWHDPAVPRDLTGSGYAVFNPAGMSFTGKLWTSDGTRTYDWNAWREQASTGAAPRRSVAPQNGLPDDQTQADDLSPDQSEDSEDDTDDAPATPTPSVPGNPYGY